MGGSIATSLEQRDDLCKQNTSENSIIAAHILYHSKVTRM